MPLRAAEQFRKDADECFERAKAAVDPAARAAWLEMAQYWLEKAMEAEERRKPG
jgi:hypothetical protein